MRRRSITAGALAASLIWAGAAQAEASGACTYQDSQVTFIDGAAWLEPQDSNEAEPGPDGEVAPSPLHLAFSTFALDAGQIARSEDRREAFRDQGFGQEAGAARFELTVQEGVVTQHYLWISPGTNLSYGSNQLGRYTPGQPVEGRAIGTYRFGPEDGQDLDCSIAFDLAILGDAKDAPPLPGLALPTDGGAPGAAYLALNRALHAGDIDTMLKLLPADRAAELRKARASPEFAAQIDFVQALSPSDVKITGGRQDGDRAWLNFTAKEGGENRLGEVEMKREGDLWVMLKESTRSAK